MDGATEPPTLDVWEQRAPGWSVRCLKCGFKEPWGKYGYRLHATGRPFKLRRCPRCRHIGCHAVERRLISFEEKEG
jgi:NAD-dependent SIR2 family protein deacetylase